MKNKMTEPTKEQVEKWRNEFGIIFWDNSLPKYTVELAWQGYLAAKKSAFEEIKTIKEQLAKAEQRIFHLGECSSLWEYQGICDCGYEQYFKEKQDKENKDEK